MNNEFFRDLGLAATMAINQLKGVCASNCFELIRSYTGSSYMTLIGVLVRASKLEVVTCDEANLVLKLCSEINRLNRSIDLDRALLVISSLYLSEDKAQINDDSSSNRLPNKL
jgi:hypothetical protein